jgi:ketosteroid isomerase-like protein
VTNAPVAKGLQEIRGMLVDLMKDPGLSIEMGSTMTEVAQSGDIGYQRGYYTLHVTDEKTKKPITETGTSLLVYKKQQDGSWKISEDINVAGPPAVAPK